MDPLIEDVYMDPIETEDIPASHVSLPKGILTYTQTLHVWYIYLHLDSLGGTCRLIYHTLSIWDMNGWFVW